MSHEPLVSEVLIARQPPEAQAVIRILLAKIAALQAEVAELKAELRSVRKSPRNSSLPPSSEHPHAKPTRSENKSGKRRGGQPGHEKAERALVPPERIAETVVLKPHHCRRCGTRLTGTDPEPLQHQVWELPEIQPLITEYQRHRLSCSRCGTTTCAELPQGVPTGQSGPRFTAFAAMLMAHFRLSKRRVGLFCETVLNIPCSPGLAVKLQSQATVALRPAYGELLRALPRQRRLRIDESPTREGSLKSWLWTCVAGNFTLFAQRPSRGGKVLDELLTEKFRGIATCDRARMYWRLRTLQWCWAHLKRDFQALAESPVETVRELGKELLRETGIVFRQWSRCRDGTISRKGLKSSLGRTRRAVTELLRRGLTCGSARTAGICRELLWYGRRLWTFVEHPGVEPTNNGAERSLRHAVIWRKLSFGTQSAAGSRFVETLLSVLETCRQQGRDAFAFVTLTLTRHLAHQPVPSLLDGV